MPDWPTPWAWTDDAVLVCEDGDQFDPRADDGLTRLVDEVPAGYLYVDGIIGDVGAGVLRDRRVLAEEGVVVVVVTVDMRSGAIITGPEIITRGWVYAPEAEDLLDQCAEAVRDAIKETFAHGGVDIETLQRKVRRAAGQLRQRADEAATHDRARRHGGLTFSELAQRPISEGEAVPSTLRRCSRPTPVPSSPKPATRCSIVVSS